MILQLKNNKINSISKSHCYAKTTLVKKIILCLFIPGHLRNSACSHSATLINGYTEITTAVIECFRSGSVARGGKEDSIANATRESIHQGPAVCIYELYTKLLSFRYCRFIPKKKSNKQQFGTIWKSISSTLTRQKHCNQHFQKLSTMSKKQ